MHLSVLSHPPVNCLTMSQHSSLLAVDKNELMKERVRLEKVKKSDKRPNSDTTAPQPSQKKKRKHPGNSAGDQDKEKQLKEKDDKKKKKRRRRKGRHCCLRHEKLRLRPDEHTTPSPLATSLRDKKLWLLMMYMFLLPLVLLNQLHYSLQTAQTTATTVTEAVQQTVGQTLLLLQACSPPTLPTEHRINTTKRYQQPEVRASKERGFLPIQICLQ